MGFMQQFGGTTPTAEQAANNFISRFSGMTESYFFYDKSIELRYEPKEHIYYLLQDGKLIPQKGVTTVCHIIDKSLHLLPWACKMMAAKLIATVPTSELPTGDKIVHMMYNDLEKLILEAKSAHKEKLEEAADVGHIAHDWIEQYIKSVLTENEARKIELLARFPDDERARNCCIAALDWMQRHDVRWLGTERKIYSRVHQYAGTMDGLALVSSCDDPTCCRHQFKDRLSIIDWKSSNYLYIEYLYQTAAYEAAYEEEFGVDVKDRWVIRLGKDNGEFDPWHVGEENFEADFHGFLTALEMTRSVDEVTARMKERTDAIRAEKKIARDAAREAKKLAIKEAKAKAKAEKKAASEAKKAAVKEAKAKTKQDKADAKKAALALRCKSADKYKGKRAPTCNKGNPCLACLEIYRSALLAKADKEVKQLVDIIMKEESNGTGTQNQIST